MALVTKHSVTKSEGFFSKSFPPTLASDSFAQLLGGSPFLSSDMGRDGAFSLGLLQAVWRHVTQSCGFQSERGRVSVCKSGRQPQVQWCSWSCVCGMPTVPCSSGAESSVGPGKVPCRQRFLVILSSRSEFLYGGLDSKLISLERVLLRRPLKFITGWAPAGKLSF